MIKSKFCQFSFSSGNLRGCRALMSNNESRSKQLEDARGYSVFCADYKSDVGFSEGPLCYDEKQSTMVENHCFGHP
jgi:hypothetical protein